MIGYQYTITNKKGESFKINDFSDPDNIIALQQYPDMDVDVKNNEINLEGQHGIWDFFSYFGKRQIAFNGVIVSTDEEGAEELRANIVKVLSLPIQPTTGSNGYVTVSWTDATGAAWSFDAKISRSPKFSRNLNENFRLDFLITLKTDNPFILSSQVNLNEGLRGLYAFGVHFPITLPASILPTNFNAMSVNNDGSLDVDTIIRLYGEGGGEITNPTIENQTTGKKFTLETTIPGSDYYVEIDSSKGSVVDQDGNDLSSFITGDSEFLLVQTGINSFLYTADEDARSPAAAFSVVFRSTKI